MTASSQSCEKGPCLQPDPIVAICCKSINNHMNYLTLGIKTNYSICLTMLPVCVCVCVCVCICVCVQLLEDATKRSSN